MVPTTRTSAVKAVVDQDPAPPSPSTPPPNPSDASVLSYDEEEEETTEGSLQSAMGGVPPEADAVGGGDAGGGVNDEAESVSASIEYLDNLEHNEWDRALRFCKFNTRARSAFYSHGIITVLEFLQLSPDDFKDLASVLRASQKKREAHKFKFPLLAMKTLRLLYLWLEYRNRRGQSLDPSLFTYRQITQWKARVRAKGTRAQKAVAPPPELKRPEQWPAYWEWIESQATNTEGFSCIGSLSYLLRKNSEVTEAARQRTYRDLDADIAETFLHEGEEYTEDNKKLWNVLQPHFSQNQMIWPYVKKYRSTEDAREACMALVRQMEGVAVSLTRITKAWTIINDTVYSGKGKFTLEEYTGKHQAAHNDLEELRDPISEQQKIRHWMDGIRCERTRHFLTFITSSPEKYGEFEDAQQFLKTAVLNSARVTQTQTPRLVASLATTQPDPKKKKGKGKGKGANKKKGWTYTSEEWNKLSSEEKSKVQADRAAARKKEAAAAKTRQVASLTTSTRQVSGLTANATNKPEEAPVEGAKPVLNAGDQFGPRSYKKKAVAFEEEEQEVVEPPKKKRKRKGKTA